MNRQEPPTGGLSRRTFIIAAAGGGIALGLAKPADPAVAAVAPLPSTTPPEAERPHRTLLGLL